MTWLSENLPNAGTFSKSPLAWGLPNYFYAKEAQGNRVLLNDDRWYKDWTSALGANLLGQGIRSYGLDEYLSRQLRRGTAFTLPHWLEAEAAEKLATLLARNVPSLNNDMGVRWCGTGTDAVAMAVRLARAVTGREWIIVFKNSYHGWADWTIARTEPAAGIPIKRAIDAPTSELPMAFEDYKPAAVVFEHPPLNPPPDWWSQVRKLCDENDVLLIADEVVTGLRNAPGGACQLYGIEPDLICMGKALGNGLPVAALVGRRELMDRFAGKEPVFCSSTSWGNTLSLAAANFVLDLWLERGESLVNNLWAKGQLLIDELKGAGWSVDGHPPRSVLRFESPYERKFFIEGMRLEGHLFNRPNFVNLQTSQDDIEQAGHAAKKLRQELEAFEPGFLEDYYQADELPLVLFEGR